MQLNYFAQLKVLKNFGN